MGPCGRMQLTAVSWIRLGLALAPSACHDFVGTTTPVPPVHRVPPDVAGAVVLVDKDPTIETTDPNHVVRANEQRVPQGYRASMETALGLAGLRVTHAASEPHDLVAKLAIAVTEEPTYTRQVYRCGLAAPTGEPVEQIDWTWPRGTYVAPNEVFDFATHNVATEIATSPRVAAYLRKARQAHPPATSSGTSPQGSIRASRAGWEPGTRRSAAR